MIISALSSLLYIILTAVFDQFQPPPLTSYVQLLPLIPLISLLHFTKSLESLTRYIIQTFKPLLQISLVLIFVLGVYSLVGIKLFGHSVARRCRNSYLPTGSNWPLQEGTRTMLCGYKSCPTGGYCRAWYNLEDDYPELYKNRPKDLLKPLRTVKELNYGFTNYSNFINALTTNLIIIAGDDWSEILYIVKFIES